MLTQQIPARTPAIQRSRLMLEAVSELVGANEWRDKQVMIYMRPQGDAKWRTKFYASDGPDSIDMVVSGEADIAICNPGGVLGMAFKGKGPFKKPLPLRFSSGGAFLSAVNSSKNSVRDAKKAARL